MGGGTPGDAGAACGRRRGWRRPLRPFRPRSRSLASPGSSNQRGNAGPARLFVLLSALLWLAGPAAASDPAEALHAEATALLERAAAAKSPLAAARAIEDAAERDWALRKIEDARKRPEALRTIAEAQAKAGQFDAALATARAIDDAVQRAWALHAIAEARAKTGQIEAALATVNEISEPVTAAGAYAGIARALVGR